MDILTVGVRLEKAEKLDARVVEADLAGLRTGRDGRGRRLGSRGGLLALLLSRGGLGGSRLGFVLLLLVAMRAVPGLGSARFNLCLV